MSWAQLVLVLVFSFSCQQPASANPQNDALDDQIMDQAGNITNGAGVLTIPTISIDLLTIIQLAVHQEVKKLKEENVNLARGLITPNKIYPASDLDLIELGGKNYFFSKNQKLSWIDAVMFCRLYGMELASVETRDENQLIVNHLKQISLSTSITYISGNKIGRSTYKWLNGEPVIFENWHPGAPPHFATEHCMLYQYNTWSDYHCSGHEHHFICEQN